MDAFFASWQKIRYENCMRYGRALGYVWIWRLVVVKWRVGIASSFDIGNLWTCRVVNKLLSGSLNGAVEM